ncbi:hypothetical protein [Janthinobacterium violaceinigrum]|uniref:Uncharacterized protein n=1 Tax=Janthinobacterium violaceinigrum TaxID=2654252 RepID=A0A6I1I6C8_9BURK|nr:hypothetical protein [Janthinobacterium violaceinigrum]KAB8065249.1 hypothetical protein GCN75_09620 [Janthinobacterium violaceinigrum]
MLLGSPNYQQSQPQPELKLPPPRNPDIRPMLKQSADTPGASIMVVGYAAHGREQAGKSLEVVHAAMRKNTLKAGSTVILHVSGQADTAQHLKALAGLQLELQKSDINVVIAEAPKSYADAVRQGGLSGLGARWKRPEIDSLEQASLHQGMALGRAVFSDEEEIGALTTSRQGLEKLHSLDAGDLMNSLKDIVGAQAMKEKVRVLTDSNHALQHAASRVGVPKNHRLDQQQNDVMFKMKSKGPAGGPAASFRKYEAAVLEKMEAALGTIKAKSITSRADVRDKAVDYFLRNARNAAGPKIEGKTQGILCHDSVWDRDKGVKVKNIVYVSVQSNQDLIAAHIKKQMSKGEDTPPYYKETMFVFCGPEAVPGVDAVSLAQAADADGIADAGDVSNDSAAYLSEKGGSRAQLIKLEADGGNVPTITPEKFEEQLEEYIKFQFEKSVEKYESGNTTKDLHFRMGRTDTIVAAHDSLFPNSSKGSEKTGSVMYDQREKDYLAWKANRKFLEMMSRILKQFKEAEMQDGEIQDQPIEIKMSGKKEGTSLILKEWAKLTSSQEDTLKFLVGETEYGKNNGEKDKIQFLRMAHEFLHIAAKNDGVPADLKDDKAALKERNYKDFKTKKFIALRELEETIFEAYENDWKHQEAQNPAIGA